MSVTTLLLIRSEKLTRAQILKYRSDNLSSIFDYQIIDDRLYTIHPNYFHIKNLPPKLIGSLTVQDLTILHSYVHFKSPDKDSQFYTLWKFDDEGSPFEEKPLFLGICRSQEEHLLMDEDPHFSVFDTQEVLDGIEI